MKTIIAALLALTALASCGGADGPVPDVVGERLDVAKSEMSDAGHETEELGGGTFGILNESNWTVCETDPPAGSRASGAVKLIVDRTCQNSASTEEETEPTQEDLAEQEESLVEEEPSASSSVRIRVPRVVGMNHQAAQNRLQAAGLYMLEEEDATGQGRMLLYDRNWVVVSQSPRAGARVSEDRTILLRSKKIGE